MDSQIVVIAVGSAAVVLVLALVMIRLKRLRRLPGIETLDAELRRAFQFTMGWSVLGGVLVGVGLCWATAGIVGAVRMPRWIPPVSIFVPLAIGGYAIVRAARPPLSRR